MKTISTQQSKRLSPLITALLLLPLLTFGPPLSASVASVQQYGTLAQSSDGLVVFQVNLYAGSGQNGRRIVAGDKVNIGEPVHANFFVENVSGRAVTVRRLIMGGRGPGANSQVWNAPNVDWPADTNITIPAGGVHEYFESRSFSTPGDYFGEPSYQNASGQWGGIPIDGTNPARYARIPFQVVDPNAPPPPPPPAATNTPVPPQPPPSSSTGDYPWFIDCAEQNALACTPATLTVSDLPQKWQRLVLEAADTWNGAGTRFQFVNQQVSGDKRNSGVRVAGIPVAFGEVRAVQLSQIQPDLRPAVFTGNCNGVGGSGPCIGLSMNQLVRDANNRSRTIAVLLVFNDLIFDGGIPGDGWNVDDYFVHPLHVDLQTVALHELGHVLGLEHSANTSATMYIEAVKGWQYWAGFNKRTLHTEDISRIKSLYPLVTTSKVFPETGKAVTGRFQEVWQGGRSSSDSVYINGLPLTDERNEASPTDGKTYKTQWFERARAEFHPENQPPFDVLFGLLGVTAAKGRQNEAPFRPVPRPAGGSPTYASERSILSVHTFNLATSSQSGLQWFPETQHTLGDNSEGGKAIAHFWTQLSGIPQFGFPISQPFMERSKDDGKTYLVQYFERQRFEYHPENKGTRYEVLLGRLGAEQANRQSGVVSTPTPTKQSGNGGLLSTISVGSSVSGVAFSPDGQTLASGANDNTVRLWKVSDGTLIRTLQGHTAALNSVAFSPDGQTLASGANDNTVRLWKVSDGTLIRKIEGFTRGVTSTAFSPDGQTLVAGSADGTAKIWRVSDGALVRTLQGMGGEVHSVAFSPNGEVLASGYHFTGEVKIWRVSDGALVRTLQGGGVVFSVAFSRDGQTLASAGEDRTVKLWNVPTGSLLRTLPDHKMIVNSVAFSPDGQTLASASYDKTVKMWKVADGSLMNSFEGHTDWVVSVAFSPNGRTIASGSLDATLRLWNTPGP